MVESNKITKIIDIYKNDVLGQKNEGFKIGKNNSLNIKKMKIVTEHMI